MDKNDDFIRLKAYAKINLSLYITGQKKNGYHLIDSVMMPIDLYDAVTIKKSNSGIKINCDSDIPKDSSNTAYKAASLLMDEHTDIEGVEITIRKNIPSMAGLGGGSADAAATLAGMNVLFNLNENMDKLYNIALKIGADVPFFLEDGIKRVQGIGEIISPIETNIKLHMVLIKPKASLSTPMIYKKYDELSNKYKGDCDNLIEAIKTHDINKISDELHNDLQQSAILMCPEVLSSTDFLFKNGALNSIMTGSGSCVFGIFEDTKKAQRAISSYKGTGNIFYVQSKNTPIQIIN